jgi:hypothetical protein
LKIVFDRKNNCLICEPTGLKVFLIEALADDDSLLCGVINILFPNRYWVKDVYVGKKGNIFMGYLKHVVNLI